ncbi:hypothetical protein GIB67_040478 [Kingdonia uniflora]|uniref:Uncharacterized protein n=1 Tax=Kingdonia uniflora TaxID=39325 RepID=A0A7J7L593_9MAGN|nr:hypothetical protein GIB67_040478 [Kingdonia uniflora]
MENKIVKAINVSQVFHMNAGNGEESYATNSNFQRCGLTKTKHFRDKAILQICSSTSKTLGFAELGCATGSNTLFVASELMDTVYQNCCELGRPTPEFHIYLNDLPGNDFNSTFQSLQGFYDNIKDTKGYEFGPCFVYGVPGSFYGRLFPSQSLHFVHSSYSLHWLSQVRIVANSSRLYHNLYSGKCVLICKVPQGIEGNKRNVYMSKSSPPSVLNAYFEQFHNDFSSFLKSRSVEVVEGGGMVFMVAGRRSEDRTSNENAYIWELIGVAINELVSKGVIEDEKLHSFNFPLYMPSPTELKYLIKSERSFVTNAIEAIDQVWTSPNTKKSECEEVVTCLRAVMEPLLAEQFGKEVMEELFSTFREIVFDRYSKEKNAFTTTVLVVSLTRMG